jgi:flagellar motor switch protein FliN/FliY
MSVSAVPNLDVILDVELELTADIGGASMTIAQLLALGPGALVEFDRAVDSPIDLKVNGRRIARGEIVAVDGRFGVRLTELVISV